MDNKTGNSQNGQVVEIDLLEVFGLLLHWAWLIVFVALVFGIIGYGYSRFVMPEKFQSTTVVYVFNKSSTDDSSISNADLTAGTQLTKDYAEMIVSRYVLENVIQRLQLPFGYEGLKGMVSVTTPANTRMIRIAVTDTDPQRAQTIANEIREVASEHISSVMINNTINIVDEANYPTHRSSPSYSKNALMAALIGAMLVSAVVILRYILDDTVKTGEDVERYLGISCLALIPIDPNVVSDSDKGKGKKSSGRRMSSSQSRRNSRELDRRLASSADLSGSGSRSGRSGYITNGASGESGSSRSGRNSYGSARTENRGGSGTRKNSNVDPVPDTRERVTKHYVSSDDTAQLTKGDRSIWQDIARNEQAAGNPDEDTKSIRMRGNTVQLEDLLALQDSASGNGKFNDD